MSRPTTYREELAALSRSIGKAVRASADDVDVTISEWAELRKAQEIVKKLAHKHWQRDTFTHTILEKVNQ